MTTVLVYGDSNSHGTLPLEQMDIFARLPRGQRWPDIMASQLAATIPNIEVINESLPGRTTVHDDLIDGRLRNGITVLPAILQSHRPIDLLIFMLGTNDLKARFSVGAYEIARSLRRMAIEAQTSEAVSDIFLVSPVHVRETGTLAATYAGAEVRQQDIAQHIQDVALQLGAGFLDANQFAEISAIDGVHYGQTAHRAIGEAMAEAVLSRLMRTN